MKKDVNNLFIYHFFTPVEYMFYAIIFFRHFQSNKLRRIILTSILLFTLYSLLNSFIFQSLTINNSNAIIVESLLLLTWCLIYFRDKMIAINEIQLIKDPLFWVVCGILFYFLGNIFVESLLNYLIKKEISIARSLYKLSYIFSYILFVSMIVGLSYAKNSSNVNNTKNG